MSTGSLEPAPSRTSLRIPRPSPAPAQIDLLVTPLLLESLTYGLTLEQKSLAGGRQWLLLGRRGNQGLRTCWSYYLCGSTLASAVTRQFAELVLQLREFLVPEPVRLCEGVHSKCGVWPQIPAHPILTTDGSTFWAKM